MPPGLALLLAAAALLGCTPHAGAGAQLLAVLPGRGVPGDTVTLSSPAGGLASTRTVHLNRAQTTVVVAGDTAVTVRLPPAVELAVPTPGTALPFTVTLADGSTLASEGFLLFADEDVRTPPLLPLHPRLLHAGGSMSSHPSLDD